MPRIQPLPRAELSDLEEGFAATEARMGFVPNSVLTMALRPEIAKAFSALATTVLGPGAVPLALKKLATSRRHDALVALGCVIRGATPHFDSVAGEASRGISQASWAER